MRFKNIVSWTVLVGVIAGFYLAITNVQDIRDWHALRNYDPPARIVKLADTITLKPDTRRVFYVNHPSLEKKAEFNGKCDTKEKSIVLGCFNNLNGIFLLDVDDPRLSGVIEVTAAHEVLHAEYDRLSSTERNKVDKMTNDFFKTLKDERIIKTVENYRAKDPKVVPNELHSILGTEVAELPKPLEDYYSQYFSNRKQIVKFSNQYEQVFVEIENRVENLDNQLDSIKQQIDNNQSRLAGQDVELQSRRQELDKLLQENKVEEYNAKVATFNQLVGDYNRIINESRQLASRYNQIVQERNSLVTAEQELKQALDSSIIPKEKSR